MQTAALLDLGRVNEGEAIVAELTRRGYRRPMFVKLVRDRKCQAARRIG